MASWNASSQTSFTTTTNTHVTTIPTLRAFPETIPIQPTYKPLNFVKIKLAADTIENALAPTDIGMGALVPTVVFCTLALIVVLARLYTRGFLVKAIGPEDGLVCISMVRTMSTELVEEGKRTDLSLPSFLALPSLSSLVLVSGLVNPFVLTESRLT
jgi:hypothetical protein